MKKTQKQKKNKKAIIMGSIILALIIALSVTAIILKTPPRVISLSEEGLPTDGVNLIAHRGFSAVAPENSTAAFIKAGEAKFFAAECDIQLTKDEIWVLNHDKNIKRMTNGRGEISQMTLEEIRQYKINGGYNSGDYSDQKIITLGGYLMLCDMYDIIPQIEIKKGNNRCLEKIFEALDEYEGMREKAIIISFDKEILKNIRALDSDIEIWYLVEEISDEAISFCKENNSAIAFDGNNYLKKGSNTIPKAQSADIKLAAWTIDNPKVYKQLYDLGIRNFTTNRFVK